MVEELKRMAQELEWQVVEEDMVKERWKEAGALEGTA